MKQLMGTVTSITRFDAEHFSIKVSVPNLEEPVLPGQFFQLKSPAKYLRRPISVARVKGHEVIFYVKILGEGTAAIGKLGRGDSLDLIGPLGRGFVLDDQKKRGLLLGGGIGIAPLIELSHALGIPHDARIGYTGDALFDDDFERPDTCVSYSLTGKAMKKGFPTQGLEEELKAGTYDVIYACGPMPLLAAVQRLGEAFGVETQLLMEEKMACGIGACLGCTQKIKDERGYKLLRLCKEGPMFYGSEVIFDEA